MAAPVAKVHRGFSHWNLTCISYVLLNIFMLYGLFSIAGVSGSNSETDEWEGKLFIMFEQCTTGTAAVLHVCIN